MYELWNKLGVKQYYKLTAVQQGPVAYWIWYWVHTNAVRVQLPVVTSIFSSQKASFRASTRAPIHSRKPRRFTPYKEKHQNRPCCQAFSDNYHIRKNIHLACLYKHLHVETFMRG